MIYSSQILAFITRSLCLLLLCALSPTAVFSQCTVDSLVFNDSACNGDLVDVKAYYDSQLSVEIDACSESMTSIASQVTYPIFNSSTNSPRNISVVKDQNGNWFGLVKDANLTNVIRLSFGSDLSNTPVIDTLNISSSISLTLTTRGGFRFIHSNDNWFAITPMLGGRLVILPFGSDLSQSNISAVVHINSTLMPNPAAIDFTTINDSIYITILNQTGLFSVMNFGPNSFDTIYSSISHSTFIDSNTISNGRALEVVNHCGQLHVFAAGISKSMLAQLSFGSSFFNTPTHSQVAGGVNSPAELRHTFTGGNHQVWVKHDHATLGFTRFDLDFSLSNLLSSQTFSDNSSTLRGKGFDIAYDDGEYTVLTSYFSTKQLTRVTFGSNCSAGEGYFNADSASILLTDTGSFPFTVRIDRFNEVLYEAAAIYSNSIPTIQFSWTGVCLNDTTSFSDSSTSSSPIQSWNWELGDGSFAAGQQPSHLYIDTGDYVVKLQVASVNGCIAQDSQNLEIHSLPQAQFDFELPCLGRTIEMSDQSTIFEDSVISAFWIIDDSDSLSGLLVNYVFDSLDFVPVMHVALSNFGCADTSRDTVEVLPAPQAQFSMQNTCFEDTVEFQNQTISSIIFSDRWFFGDGDSSILSAPSHSYLDTGFYEILYIAQAQNMCSDTLVDTVRISAVPLLNLLLPSSNICSGESNQIIDFTNYANESKGVPFWLLGSDTLRGDSLTLSFDSAISNVSLNFNVNIGSNCALDSTLVFSVLKGPETGFAFSKLCLNDSTEFTDSSNIATGQSIAFSEWSFNDGSASANGLNVEHLFLDTGFFTVNYAIETDSGCSGSSSETLRIHQLPEAMFLLSAPFCTDLEINSSVSFSADPLDSIIASEWRLVGQGLDSSFDYPALLSISNAGTYSLSLSGITNEGCAFSTTQALELNASPIADYSYDTACAELATQFTDLYSGTNYEWTWQFEGVGTILGDDPTVVFPASGIYSSSLLIIDRATGCEDTVSAPVIVSGIDEVSITAAGLCKGSTAEFEASASLFNDQLASVDWIINNTSGFSGTNQRFSTEDDTEALNVSASFLTANGCRSNSTRTWTLEEARLLDLTTSFGSKELTLDYELTSADSIVDAFLQTSDGQQNDTTSGSFTFQSSGVYVIETVAMFSNGCSSTKKTSISVGDPNPQLLLTEFSVGLASGFRSFEAGVLNNGNAPAENFMLEVTGQSGETLRQFINQGLDPFESILIPLTGSLRASTSNNYYCIEIVQVNDAVLEDPDALCQRIGSGYQAGEFWPNPTVDKSAIRILADADEQIELALYNYAGAIIEEFEYTVSSDGTQIIVEVDASLLNPGVYILSFQINDELFIRRLIKLRP